ncbi:MULTISPECIES: DUF4383 domain-containing protein [Cellulomonas]|uniref:DUF4383 domain-containing protein n=1 Tax=Cellulomonas TaxID=1707 RepID=UPI0010A8AD40|nr:MULTISPECIES: DUF4383 domain-containing protein [Cellulomonas]
MSKSPNRLVAAIFGAVYTLVGLAGFLVTGGVPFASQEGELLLGFEVNPLHNIVHLVIGIALLLASRTVGGARSANLAVGAVYLLVGILGLFIIDTEANILALNGADNVLHFGTAIILLGVALGADRDRARTARTA